MRIGIDIDNTLNNFTKRLVTVYNREFSTNLHEDDFNKDYTFRHITGWSAQELLDFLIQYEDDIYRYTEVKDEYVKLAIEGLRLRHNQLYVFTNRLPERDSLKDLTYRWLEYHHLLPFLENVYFIHECKQDFCKQEGIQIDVMVEDNLHRAKAFLEQKIPVVLFNYDYNKGYHHRLLHRVNDWWEAFQQLVKLEWEVFNHAYTRRS